MSVWTPLLLTHVTAASVSVPLGAYQLWRTPKGDRQHRLVGRVWALLMMWTALSSFGIRHLGDGGLSLLHILSVITVVSLVLGVRAARRGDTRAHVGAMRGSWLGSVGALVGAVVVPQRAIPTFAVDHPLGLAAALLAVLGTSAVVVALCRVSRPRGGADRMATHA